MSGIAHASARVLVVDDNAAFVENLAEILTTEGYAVRTAGTFAGAKAEACHGFDVALVDVKLPDGLGTSLVGELKKINTEAEVILLTGFASLESAAEAVRAGACAYLLKPCATTELLLAVEQGLRQARLHQEKRDLARRAQVSEKLAAIGTFTAGLSHEIRNPLNSAALQLNVVERRVGRLAAELQPPLLEPLRLVKDEIRRLDHILQDFLQFARPVQFTAQPLDTAVMIGKVVSILRAEAEQRGVKLEVACAPHLTLSGDEDRLRQVVMNLALNALDAAPKGGWVRIAATQEGREIAITVEDNGAGIPPELLGRLFEPFFTTKPSGSGLGLSIVHAIITQHRGTVTAENVPGGGARMTLRVPVA